MHANGPEKKIEAPGCAQIWGSTPRKAIFEVYLRTSALICGWPYFFVFALIRVHSWLVRFLRVLSVFVVKFVFIEDFAVPHHGAIRRSSLSWYELEAVSTKARPGLPAAKLPPG
jgi:hypothetical protein